MINIEHNHTDIISRTFTHPFLIAFVDVEISLADHQEEKDTMITIAIIAIIAKKEEINTEANMHIATERKQDPRIMIRETITRVNESLDTIMIQRITKIIGRPPGGVDPGQQRNIIRNTLVEIMNMITTIRNNNIIKEARTADTTIENTQNIMREERDPSLMRIGRPNRKISTITNRNQIGIIRVIRKIKITVLINSMKNIKMTREMTNKINFIDNDHQKIKNIIIIIRNIIKIHR